MVEYEASGSKYESLRNKVQSLRDKIRVIEKNIANAKRRTEEDEINIEELRRKLNESDGGILTVGTRNVQCPGCKNYHVITDLPGRYDLCVVRKPGTFLKTTEHHVVTLAKDGGISYRVVQQKG